LAIEVKWIGKNAFAARSGSNHWAVMDSAHDGGDGAAPSPMEFLLMGLGGCTGIDVVSILKKMRQDVTGLNITVEGERAPLDPKVYTAITIAYRVRGRRLDEAKVRRAVELSEKQYCSVSAMLAKTADIRTEVILEEEPAQDMAAGGGDMAK
jgi:putative redox protein